VSRNLSRKPLINYNDETKSMEHQSDDRMEFVSSFSESASRKPPRRGFGSLPRRARAGKREGSSLTARFLSQGGDAGLGKVWARSWRTTPRLRDFIPREWHSRALCRRRARACSRGRDIPTMAGPRVPSRVSGKAIDIRRSI